MTRVQQGGPEPRNRSDSEPTGAPSARLTLGRNFLWMLVGLTVWSAYQAATLVLLARLGSPEVVGAYALGLAVAAPVFMFANLNLRSMQATDASATYSFRHYLAVRVVCAAVGFVVVVVLALLAYRGSAAATIIAVGMAKTVECLSDVYYGLYQREERLDRVALSLALRGALALPALAAALWLTGRVEVAAMALTAGWLVALLAHDIPCEKRLTGAQRSAWRSVCGSLRDRRARCELIATGKRLALLSLPLGITSSMTSLMANVPRYFVEDRLGAAALGVFAVLGYLPLLLARVVQALAQSAAARFGQHIRDGARGALTRLLASAVSLAALLGMLGAGGAWLLGEPVLALAFGPEYAAEWRVFVWLTAVATTDFMVAFAWLALTAARNLRVQAVVEVLAVCVVAAACAVLVRGSGLVGAAWAIGIGGLVRLVGNFGALHLAVARGWGSGKPSDKDTSAGALSPAG